MLARRSCLSVPGSSQKMLAGAAGLPADEIVIDLEDSVAAQGKEDARHLVTRFLAQARPASATLAVRVNALETSWGRADVEAMADARVDSLVVPKVESREDLREIEHLLGDGPIRLQALIETAAGLQHAGEIAAASPLLDTLIIGYEDLAASLGRSSESPPEAWLYAQETVLVAARSAGIQAIDGPYLKLDDEPGLQARARHAQKLGYDGKWAIHPRQIEPINEAFTPLPDELERAAAVLSALEGSDAGAVRVDGAMVDEATRKHAELVVARGEAAGL